MKVHFYSSVRMLALHLLLACALMGCMLTHAVPDARPETGSDGQSLPDTSQDVPLQDLPIADQQITPDESSPDVMDVVVVDEGMDTMPIPDAEAGVDAPADTAEAGVDSGVDAVAPLDVVIPTDVRPDVPVDIFVPPPDVPMPMDSGPLPVARYEFFMASTADATATDPMHLKFYDGSSWTVVTCMNTGSTTMETLPGSAPQWRRCDTDTLYRRFIFDYRSTLGGAPETRDTIGGGGCRVRAGFTARISQYDRSSGMWIEIATHSQLITDCAGVYWQHQLPDSSIRDF